jgi:hypothetical protein
MDPPTAAELAFDAGLKTVTAKFLMRGDTFKSFTPEDLSHTTECRVTNLQRVSPRM